jgi:hypothetical protein
MTTSRMSATWTRLGEALRIGVVRRLLVVVLLVVCYQAWLSIQAHGKASDDVGVDADAQGRFSVDVRLGFPPERFHLLELQHHGRITGSDDTVVHLRGVSEAGVDALARFYWVEEITPGEDDSEDAR